MSMIITLVAGVPGIGHAESARVIAATENGPGHHVPVRHACARPEHAGLMSCFALVRTDLQQRAVDAGTVPPGYGPADLRSAYALPSSAGAGRTVAVVDAYDYPSAESDLAVYRAQYGLPPCTTANGCFAKVDEHGGTSWPVADPGWAQEAALDIDMVSATCPNCRILLVEATQASYADLGTAVDTAVGLGAVAVSNSYGAPESAAETAADSYYDHPGVAVTVSAGDSAGMVDYPASSRYVTAVGGTSLSSASGGRGWRETAWSGGGSGCSVYESKPVWQSDPGCGRRTVVDVSAVADPATGVAVYDSYQAGFWQVFGGTSVSAPIVAGVYALAGRPATGTYPAAYPYAHPMSLNDVTSGANGTCGTYLCTAGVGYDGPTGLGTPAGVAAFAAGGVTVANPGNQTSTVGVPIGLQLYATDSAGCLLNYGATGLPAGLAINSFSGLISGTPTAVGANTTVVTATDCAGASGSTSFTWTITNASGVVNGGFETGTLLGWTSSGVTGTVASGQHSGSRAAVVGSAVPSGNSAITQTFTVPTGSSAVSFWYDVFCPDTVVYDWATATLKDNTTGTSVTALAKTCVPNSGWKPVTVAVTAGHSYTLSLISHDDYYPTDPTYTYYDDVTTS